jgi:hypothetical protein
VAKTKLLPSQEQFSKKRIYSQCAAAENHPFVRYRKNLLIDNSRLRKVVGFLERDYRRLGERTEVTSRRDIRKISLLHEQLLEDAYGDALIA